MYRVLSVHSVLNWSVDSPTPNDCADQSFPVGLQIILQKRTMKPSATLYPRLYQGES